MVSSACKPEHKGMRTSAMTSARSYGSVDGVVMKPMIARELDEQRRAVADVVDLVALDTQRLHEHAPHLGIILGDENTPRLAL